MRLNITDGGRIDAGFKGKTGDCVTRAIVIANGLKYRETYKALCALCTTMTGGLETSVRKGCPSPVAHEFLKRLGWETVLTPGQYLKDIPRTGTFIAALARHDVCVIDGTLQDSWDSRISKRTKCGSPKMLGYYRQTLKPF